MARGRASQWLPQFSVLLDNRNLDGKPGYWLATPLLLDGGRARPCWCCAAGSRA